jgi:hypothetical protein
LASRIRAVGMASPATLVVGEVARRALEAGAVDPAPRGGDEVTTTDRGPASTEVA